MYRASCDLIRPMSPPSMARSTQYRPFRPSHLTRTFPAVVPLPQPPHHHQARLFPTQAPPAAAAHLPAPSPVVWWAVQLDSPSWSSLLCLPCDGTEERARRLTEHY
ncbi:uncharacterized protein MYCGRDRAFT_102375, partial [Zymoseptoria tritici IPO323]